jgi:hypothetical protein
MNVTESILGVDTATCTTNGYGVMAMLNFILLTAEALLLVHVLKIRRIARYITAFGGTMAMPLSSNV